MLAAAIDYLYAHRPMWGRSAAVGKTVVSSGIIDRVATRLGRPLVEVPVGFKWFTQGLHAGTLGFAGEESAGASFLGRDGTAWTTDKDGLIVGLLAAEMKARTGTDPAAAYARIKHDLGQSWYERIDAPATVAQRAQLKALTPPRLSPGTAMRSATITWRPASILRKPSRGGQCKSPNLPTPRGALQAGEQVVSALTFQQLEPSSWKAGRG